MKLHLEPLAIAANVTQAAFCCLDTVLLTFGFLVMQYRRMADKDDSIASAMIISSLEKCWMAADQDIFIAAVIVNPFFWMVPFGCNPRFVVSGIINLLECLSTRFFQESTPHIFGSELRDYLTAEGQYTTLHSTCIRHEIRAQNEVCSVFTSSPGLQTKTNHRRDHQIHLLFTETCASRQDRNPHFTASQIVSSRSAPIPLPVNASSVYSGTRLQSSEIKWGHQL